MVRSNYLQHQRMMRIRAKEELSTPKKQSEAYDAIQRKIDDAWAILQEAQVMAETLAYSTDDKIQYDAYDKTQALEERITSVCNLIEDDLHISPINFEYDVEEKEEESSPVVLCAVCGGEGEHNWEVHTAEMRASE